MDPDLAPALARAAITTVTLANNHLLDCGRAGVVETLDTLAHVGSAADIGALRDKVDRVVVIFHWGIPYEREPLLQERAKAHFAIDCGADAVIEHHPHIVQPLEIYRDRPIVYSVGNFAFGSGNSRAEGLAVGLSFDDVCTVVTLYPLYVKSRDPRVAYQPKVLGGRSAERVLERLVQMSGPSGQALRVAGGRGQLDLPWTAADVGAREDGNAW